MNHMNLLPLDSHGVDFSRVRMWSLNNWSKYYRQTLLFGALQDAQINSVFNKYCVNVQGQVGSPLSLNLREVSGVVWVTRQKGRSTFGQQQGWLTS